MPTTRRDFLKTSAIAGAAVAIDGVSAFAETGPLGGNAGAEPVGSEISAPAAEYTRGIGQYPGHPSQNFSPELTLDAATYRNLALLRPAYHSSSYDYNLTAQLVTDGIKDTKLPRWVSVAKFLREPLPKQEREILLDHNTMSSLDLHGARPSVDLYFGGGEAAPEIDHIQLRLIAPPQSTSETLSFSVSVSEDGRTWKEVGSVSSPKRGSGAGLPPDLIASGPFYTPEIPLNLASQSRFYRIECAFDISANHQIHEPDLTWFLGEIAFFHGGQRVQVGGPYNFTSAWMSAGMSEEWVYVDLGASFEFDRVKLYWIERAAEGFVQVSDDAQSWRNIESLSGRMEPLDDFQLSTPVRGRFVRVLMTRPSSPIGYVLSEIEVYGHGGFVAQPKPSPLPHPRRLDLAGGAWRLQRENLVASGSEALSRTGFDDKDWVVATVPGTVLTSYLNVGAIPDPNFGENQLYISDSYFYSDFWYRKEFVAPAVSSKQSAWLNLDGINWKADVFLNGEKLGRIEGGFMRGRFDVTAKLIPGKPNALAVRIEKNATPGSCKQKTFENVGKNGGALGADNPTYHASIGWDWIPTIRGRNTGIWGDVYITVTGPVTIEDPFVSTQLPSSDASAADVTVECTLVNHRLLPVTGVLHVALGDIHFDQRMTLAPSETRKVTLDPATQPLLHMKDPKLWWPVGYGEPNLYDVTLSFEVKGKPLDSRSFKAGLRQMTFSEDGDALRIWINGRRFVARGGNWGFGESMLRYRAREFDAAVRYHREMNFTMIRNWVGQIGDEALYEACDRNGVMVWQDFWLANPWDGPDPDDDQMFLNNAKDFLLRIRNHASIGLYCGRNEGFPPSPLETGLRKLLAELHPDLHYIPSSADNVVSGHGPYQAMPLAFYFQNADTKLHSEMGAPNIPPIESVRMMMLEKSLWPQGLDWGLHDFCLEGAQGGAGFRAIIENQYGGADSAEEWIRLAQFVNYETYRAMFEAQSRNRMGLLLWMSHPCWPSFVWQTYDYFFEPTAAYFGCKKASEPLHIQWNRATDAIEVVNYSGGNVTGLAAQVEILNMNGALKSSKSVALDSREDSNAPCMQMTYPGGLSAVHFLRLKLTRGAELISSNFYLRALEEGDYRAIRQLPRTKIQSTTAAEKAGSLWRLTTKLQNDSPAPALMVRVKAIREKSGDRILPAIYSDNYIALMPGESQTITTEVKEADTRGERPAVVLAG